LSQWTTERVLAAAEAMEWCPEGSVEIRTAYYRLIRYPDWVVSPAFPAAHVTCGGVRRWLARLDRRLHAGACPANHSRSRGGQHGTVCSI